MDSIPDFLRDHDGNSDHVGCREVVFMSLGEQSAFPVKESRNAYSGDIYLDAEKGITFRQYAAVHALQGILPNTDLTGNDAISAAACAVIAADALIAELEKEKK